MQKRSAGTLLREVAGNPAIRSARVLAAVDQSTTRIITVDKTALPAGASVDKNTGNISVAVTAGVITGITRNGAAFVNAGQFALTGGTLKIITSTIEEPAA